MAGTNVVVIDRGNNTTCSINLLGATIVSWRINNVEQLWVSTKTRFDQQTEIIGGIQIIFPKYDYWKFGPAYGFARRVRWNLEKGPNKIASGDIEVIFSLRDTEYTKSIWNFSFLIIYRLILREKELRFYVTIKNTSDKMHLTFDFLIFDYLKVPNMNENQIVGLYRSTYYDRLINKDSLCAEKVKFFNFAKDIDRIYNMKTPEIILANRNGDTLLEIRKDNFPDILIWRKHDDEDFDEDDYLSLFGVGTGYINRRVKIKPGQTLEANKVIKFPM